MVASNDYPTFFNGYGFTILSNFELKTYDINTDK